LQSRGGTMSKLSRRLAPALIASLLCACSTTSASYTALNPAPHDLYVREPRDVEVFSSAPPDRPHVDVGLITVEQGDIGHGSPEALIAMLREMAARRGCDALVVAPPGSKSESALGGLIDYTESYRVYSGTCVVYRN
jgi:hypothetical protein